MVTIMKEHKGMRPQDIVVLLKIICLDKQDWKLIDLAKQLYISQSEVSEALNRCRIAGLIDDSKKKVRLLAFIDFLKYGLKYVFPAQPGAIVKGIPTAHSAPPLSEKIIGNKDIYVWADEEGLIRGQSIDPLYKNLTKAVKEDKSFYEMVTLIDSLRIGRVREVNLSTEELKKRFKIEQPI
jgi:predicted transcriptional regulator